MSAEGKPFGTALTATERMERARGATVDAVTRELALVSILSQTVCQDSHLCEPREPQRGNLVKLVCLHTPLGYLPWRLSEDELPLFAHLPTLPNHETGRSTRTDKLAVLLELATDYDWAAHLS